MVRRLQGSLPDSPPLGHHHLEISCLDVPVERSEASIQHDLLLWSEEGDAGESPPRWIGDLVERSRDLPVGEEVEAPAGQEETAVAGDVHHLPLLLLHLEAANPVLLDQSQEAEVSVGLTCAGASLVGNHPEVELHLLLLETFAQSGHQAAQPGLGLGEVVQHDWKLREPEG